MLDDNDYEGDETIIVTITSVGMGSTIAAQDAHTMTISDDEAVPSISLTPFDAAESNGSTQMQALPPQLRYDITFNYSIPTVPLQLALITRLLQVQGQLLLVP